MASYLIISNEFALEHNGHKKGCNVFSSTVTLNGLNATSANSIIEFPEIFEGYNFPEVDLERSDFITNEEEI